VTVFSDSSQFPVARAGDLGIFRLFSAGNNFMDIDILRAVQANIDSLVPGERLPGRLLCSAGCMRQGDETHLPLRRCRCPLQNERKRKRIEAGDCSVEASSSIGFSRCISPQVARRWHASDSSLTVLFSGSYCENLTPRHLLWLRSFAPGHHFGGAGEA
jgi:hypothetical protein